MLGKLLCWLFGHPLNGAERLWMREYMRTGDTDAIFRERRYQCRRCAALFGYTKSGRQFTWKEG